MTTTELPDQENVETFHNQIHGEVLHPGDKGYDEARTVWNGMIDKYPSIIAQCTGTADVITAVNFARDNEIPLSVKGGGHNVAGKAVCDEGVMIDLSKMDNVRVDPNTQTARVGPGATWADFDHEAQMFGLATTGGLDSRTGVAGLALGGGIGYLARTYGLSTDNLIAADVVTADGELVHASEDTNPDLFWGLRGGGGNFGIVTSFKFDLHEVGPEVMSAQAYYPHEDATEVLEFYREFMADAPKEVACYALLVHVPPEPPFPEEAHGDVTIGLVACYSGSIEDGKRELEPLSQFGDPILEVSQPMPYTVLQQNFDDGAPAGERYYFRAHYLNELSDETIETIITNTDPLPGPFTIVGIEPMGGAINEVDATATAYPHRDTSYSFGIWTGWSDPEADEEMIAWTK
ncbi:MAG: FAD-binding oxidoreductase, partial [Halobacteriaceae archaeon]